MQQRYYDPIAGRFLSVDPVVTDANSGKLFGRYTYVDNNPYSKVDPDGREPGEVAYGIGAGLVFSRENAQILAEVEASVGNTRAAGAIAAGQALKEIIKSPANIDGQKVTQAAGILLVAKLGRLPKAPTGPGTVPKSERDPKRLFTPAEREAKRAEQGNQCANGCGTKIDESNSAGHHIQRHADGGKTSSENHAEVCNPCHNEIHSKEKK